MPARHVIERYAERTVVGNIIETRHGDARVTAVRSFQTFTYIDARILATGVTIEIKRKRINPVRLVLERGS